MLWQVVAILGTFVAETSGPAWARKHPTVRFQFVATGFFLENEANGGGFQEGWKPPTFFLLSSRSLGLKSTASKAKLPLESSISPPSMCIVQAL